MAPRRPDGAGARGAAADARRPTAVGERLAAGDYVIAVEMDPPKGFSAAKMLAGAQTLAEAGADVIDVADSPMARMRMSPWAACRIIQEAGIETILHFPTRGRNLLRLQGDLLAVHALGIRNVFVCMGDPVTIGDYPGATDNVDVVPTALMRTITASFNEGSDRSGASIGEPTSFVVGCAVSPNAGDLEKEVQLLHKKIEAGCSFGLSQPMFTPEPLERLRDAYRERYEEDLMLPILAGVLPLVSSRHAEFLHNEVPGIVIPDDVRDRMGKAGDDGEAEGLALARDLVAQLRERAAGVYLMPPFERIDLAAEVVEAARTP
ncbi:MAG: methylenetetrahydrofolate reductase [Actinomycetota bacterium]